MFLVVYVIKQQQLKLAKLCTIYNALVYFNFASLEILVNCQE